MFFKKIIVLVTILAIIFAVKFSQRGLLNIREIDAYFEYKNGTIITYQKNIPLLSCSTGYTRVETHGGIEKLSDIMLDLSASLIFKEDVLNMQIYYLYSDKIFDYEIVFEQKINVMIAFTSSKIVVGSPLLVGSY